MLYVTELYTQGTHNEKNVSLAGCLHVRTLQ